MTTLSADQVRAKFVSEFGTIDGIIINNLTNKVSNLILRWNTFLYFYCGPKERVETLNSASGRMARLLADLLWDDTLLRIRQLTDPAKKGKNENLSLAQLTRIAKAKGVDLESLEATTRNACTPAQTYATKHLAHLDVGHALGDMDSPVTRCQTTAAVKAIAAFVHEFHLSVNGAEYRLTPIRSHDAEEVFLLRLHQGIEAEKVLEAAAIQAHRKGDWGAINRPDIPSWIHDRDDPLGDI